MRNGGAPQLTGGTYNPDASGYVIAIRQSGNYLFLGSNVRVTFLPGDGKGYVGLAKVTEGIFFRAKVILGCGFVGQLDKIPYICSNHF